TTRAAFAAAHARLRRSGGGTAPPGPRERRPHVVLRKVQSPAVRGIFPPREHRNRLPAGILALLLLARGTHLRCLRPPQSGARQIPSRLKQLPQGAPELASLPGERLQPRRPRACQRPAIRRRDVSN